MIKVMLVDDHPVILEGVRLFLSEAPDLQVIAQAANGREAIEKIKTNPPEVIIMDLNMPEMDGFEATDFICKNYPGIKVIIFSMQHSEAYVSKAFELGAKGYLLKNTTHTELIHSIKLVAEDIPYICSELSMEMLKKLISDDLTSKGVRQGRLN